MIGWGVVAGYIAGWIDKFVPSRKAAAVEMLDKLTTEYHRLLISREDTKAAIVRKQITQLRKRLEISDESI